MNKILRYSFIALLAFICNVSFGQEVTLDFTDNTNWKFPEGSSKKSKEAATYSNGTYTIGISATSDGHYWNDKDKYLIMGKNGATLTLPAFNFDVAYIQVVGRTGASSSTGQNIYVGDVAVSKATTGADKTNTYEIDTKHQAKGNVYSLKVTSKHNTQIVAIKVYKVGSDTPDVPGVTYTNVSCIKDLLTNYDKATSNLNLKLTNAKVLYVNNYTNDEKVTTINTYVREGDAAIEFRNIGFDMPVNSVINGTVKVDLVYSYGVPYLKANVATDDESLDIKESTEAAEPIVATVADIYAKKYMNDLVTIKDFTFSKEEYQSGKYNYYANEGTNKIMLYDKFSNVGGVADLTEGEKYTVVGLFGAIFKDTPEIIPTKSIAETTGITTITANEAAKNAPAYNLAGQKVSSSYKGVVVKAGKKFVQK